MNASQWISGTVFPTIRPTALNGQVSKARRTVNLLRAAEVSGYQVLLTVDHGIPRQQTMAGRSLAIALIRSRTNLLEDLLPLAPKIIDVLESIEPGQIVVIPRADLRAS